MDLSKIKNKIKNSKIVKKAINYAKNNDTKLKIFVLVIICGTMIIRGIMQQPKILDNKAEITRLNEEIQYEKARQNEVEDLRENVDTDEYIERIAREKLGMIKKNEKIFIDVSTND